MNPNGFDYEGLLVGVGATAPVVLSKPVPHPLDRIELRRVRWKEQRGDSPGPSQIV